jgi:hypothetical protein
MQPFGKLRPTPPSGDSADRDGNRLLLADQHDEVFASGDAGVEQIPADHRRCALPYSLNAVAKNACTGRKGKH